MFVLILQLCSMKARKPHWMSSSSCRLLSLYSIRIASVDKRKEYGDTHQSDQGSLNPSLSISEGLLLLRRQLKRIIVSSLGLIGILVPLLMQVIHLLSKFYIKPLLVILLPQFLLEKHLLCLLDILEFILVRWVDAWMVEERKLLKCSFNLII